MSFYIGYTIEPNISLNSKPEARTFQFSRIRTGFYSFFVRL